VINRVGVPTAPSSLWEELDKPPRGSVVVAGPLTSLYFLYMTELCPWEEAYWLYEDEDVTEEIEYI
jgi:hypothetical protein